MNNGLKNIANSQKKMDSNLTPNINTKKYGEQDEAIRMSDCKESTDDVQNLKKRPPQKCFENLDNFVKSELNTKSRKAIEERLGDLDNLIKRSSTRKQRKTIGYVTEQKSTTDNIARNSITSSKHTYKDTLKKNVADIYEKTESKNLSVNKSRLSLSNYNSSLNLRFNSGIKNNILTRYEEIISEGKNNRKTLQEYENLLLSNSKKNEIINKLNSQDYLKNLRNNSNRNNLDNSIRYGCRYENTSKSQPKNEYSSNHTTNNKINLANKKLTDENFFAKNYELRDSCLNHKRINQSKDKTISNNDNSLINNYISNTAIKTPENKLSLKLNEKTDVFDKLNKYKYIPNGTSSNDQRKRNLATSKENTRGSKFINEVTKGDKSLIRTSFLTTFSSKNVLNNSKNYAGINSFTKESTNTNLLFNKSKSV